MTEHYHGKHELAGPKVAPDTDQILAEARTWLGLWEVADALSYAEHRAALEMTERFAVLDAEAQRGNLPRAWQSRTPADGQRWTPYQLSLVATYETCPCGGPRDQKITPASGDELIDHDVRYTMVIYCTVCGAMA